MHPLMKLYSSVFMAKMIFYFALQILIETNPGEVRFVELARECGSNMRDLSGYGATYYMFFFMIHLFRAILETEEYKKRQRENEVYRFMQDIDTSHRDYQKKFERQRSELTMSLSNAIGLVRDLDDEYSIYGNPNNVALRNKPENIYWSFIRDGQGEELLRKLRELKWRLRLARPERFRFRSRTTHSQRSTNRFNTICIWFLSINLLLFSFLTLYLAKRFAKYMKDEDTYSSYLDLFNLLEQLVNLVMVAIWFSPPLALVFTTTRDIRNLMEEQAENFEGILFQVGHDLEGWTGSSWSDPLPFPCERALIACYLKYRLLMESINSWKSYCGPIISLFVRFTMVIYVGLIVSLLRVPNLHHLMFDLYLLLFYQISCGILFYLSASTMKRFADVHRPIYNLLGRYKCDKQMNNIISPYTYIIWQKMIRYRELLGDWACVRLFNRFRVNTELILRFNVLVSALLLMLGRIRLNVGGVSVLVYNYLFRLRGARRDIRAEGHPASAHDVLYTKTVALADLNTSSSALLLRRREAERMVHRDDPNYHGA